MRVTQKMAACLLMLFVLCAPAARAVGAAGGLTIQMTWNGRAVTGGSLTLYQVAPSWEGKNSPQAVERAMEYVKAEKIQGETQDVEQQGFASFESLEKAVYLVVQHEPAPGFRPINPFLVFVGEGGETWAKPKLYPDDIPQTGDESLAGVWLVLMALSLVGAGGIYFCKRRRGSDKP